MAEISLSLPPLSPSRSEKNNKDLLSVRYLSVSVISLGRCDRENMSGEFIEYLF